MTSSLRRLLMTALFHLNHSLLCIERTTTRPYKKVRIHHYKWHVNINECYQFADILQAGLPRFNQDKIPFIFPVISTYFLVHPLILKLQFFPNEVQLYWGESENL